MNYLEKKDMNPVGLKKFFEEAIVNKEAVEIHLKSSEFPHEIDLIPYDQVKCKAKWYLENIMQFDRFETVEFKEDAEKVLGVLDRKAGVVSKEITAVKINWGESSTRDYEKGNSVKEDAGMKDPYEVEDKSDSTKEDVKDIFFVNVRKKREYKNEICKKCGGEMIPQTGSMMMSHPPKYRTKCACGEISFVPTHLVDDEEKWMPLSEIKGLLR